jgi:hypothetical protein
MSRIVWNHLLCSYNIQYVYISCSRNLSIRIYTYIYIYILFIHFYCLINQLCVFIVTRSKSRKRVLARPKHVLYVRLKSIKSIAQLHTHRSNWERGAVSLSYLYQPSICKAMVKALFDAFNCVRKPWRAWMSKYEYECPSFSESNFFCNHCYETIQGQIRKKDNEEAREKDVHGHKPSTV